MPIIVFVIIIMTKKTAILREKIPYSEKINGILNNSDTNIINGRNKQTPIKNKTTLQIL